MSIPSEPSCLTFRDVDFEGRRPQEDAAVVFREHRGLASDMEVSYRDGDRYVRRIERLPLADAPGTGSAFRDGGMYLLAGGLGGVGGEIAKHLLSAHHARLLIVGRTALAPASDEGAARASLLRDLQSLPGSVRYEEVDVTDASRLQQVVAAAERAWDQPLDGVIHLAGLFAERLVAEESRETLAAILRPK